MTDWGKSGISDLAHHTLSRRYLSVLSSNDKRLGFQTDLTVPPLGHNSAFEAIWFNGPGLINETILLNGAGNATRYGGFPATLKIPKPYTINFDRPTQGRPLRYLLRIINTSFDSTFVFSIDNHKLTVIESDFVPIVPYNTTSVLVGIGQRYHVVVEANPQPNEQGSPPSDGNFWIRTGKANCFRFNQGKALAGYNRTGILRYSDSEADPISTPWQKVSLACSDEEYTNLKPILPWTVGKPPANDPSGGDGEEFTVQAQGEPTIFPLALFSMGGDDFNPLWIDYNDPTFLHLDYSGKWAPLRVIFPENYTNTSWVSSVSEGFVPRSRTPVLSYAELIQCSTGLHGHQRKRWHYIRCSSDPPPRPRLRHLATNRRSHVPCGTQSEIRESSTPRRRSPPQQWLRRDRLQNRQSGRLARALSYSQPRLFRTRNADFRAAG
jgi:Multicopper oxidase